MSLYVRVYNNFYSHRKTARLRVAIGDAAWWLPPKLWSYAADNQPDGIFKDYSAGELAMLVGYAGNATEMLEALLRVGFLDADPLRIHDWHEHNGYHKKYSDRAQAGAIARWRKGEEKKGSDLKGSDLKGKEASNATSMVEAAVSILEHLNAKANRDFRPTPENLKLIARRVEEVDSDINGIKTMIDRQCAKWNSDPKMSEFLRPETLFGKTKFSGYYDMRGLPVQPDQRSGEPTSSENLPIRDL